MTWWFTGCGSLLATLPLASPSEKERTVMHLLLNLVSASGAQQSGTDGILAAGWIVGMVGIIVGLIGASVGATMYLRGRRRNRGYGEMLGQIEEQWRDHYTEGQVRALIAERGRLLEQMRLVVPDYARYMFLQGRRQALSDSLSELYRQYDDITQRLAGVANAGGANAGGALRPDLLEAIEQDIVPAYLERQRREFWVSLSVMALLLLASVPLALPLLIPLSPLVGIAPPGGTSLLLAQVYAYVLLCGVIYLILRVAPLPRKTPGHVRRPGSLLRPLLLYALLPFLWFTATVQFFLPYLMTVMGGVTLDSLANDPEALKHAALGIVSAVLTAILLRMLPSLRHKDEDVSEDVVTYE